MIVANCHTFVQNQIAICSLPLIQPTYVYHSTSATADMCVTVQASPSTSLMDEIVVIEVGGLKPKQPIRTLRTYFHDEDIQFELFAHYTSDDEGKVNTASQPSEGGNFIGTT